MIRRLVLIIVIIFEQIGVQAPFSTEKANFIPKDPDIFSSYGSSFIEEISPLPKRLFSSDINLEARSFISIDGDTVEVLTEKESNIRVPMASTTKIMTAIVVLEGAKLDEIVTVSKNAVSAYGLGIGLRPSERITVESLLYAILLNSSNDGSVALAEHVAGNEEEFARLMNKKAKEINALDSSFTNASGLDDPNHYSTVSDLALMARYALQNSKFQEIVSIKQQTITSLEGITHYLRNSNKLIGSEFNVLGVKTGYTQEAGECLVTLAQEESKNIITVVLNSPDRFKETKQLLRWSFDSYKW